MLTPERQSEIEAKMASYNQLAGKDETWIPPFLAQLTGRIDHVAKRLDVSPAELAEYLSVRAAQIEKQSEAEAWDRLDVEEAWPELDPPGDFDPYF